MLSVCFRSCGVLLQRPPPADVAAAADGHPGLLWNTLLLHGGEDAELLRRSAGALERKRGHQKNKSPRPTFFFCKISFQYNALKVRTFISYSKLVLQLKLSENWIVLCDYILHFRPHCTVRLSKVVKHQYCFNATRLKYFNFSISRF